MKTKAYALVMIAPDGENVTEGNNFPTPAAAWQRCNDMGSRWIFYPIPVVTHVSRARTIADVPDGMPREWIGRHLSTLIRALQPNPEETLAYAEGKAPLFVYP